MSGTQGSSAQSDQDRSSRLAAVWRAAPEALAASAILILLVVAALRPAIWVGAVIAALVVGLLAAALSGAVARRVRRRHGARAQVLSARAAALDAADLVVRVRSIHRGDSAALDAIEAELARRAEERDASLEAARAEVERWSAAAGGDPPPSLER